MIRVLVVDNSRFLSRAMRTVLQKQDDVHVNGCATTREEALTYVSQCNVALVSNNLEDGTAEALIRKMVNQNPDVKVLVFGVDHSIDNILKYIEAGASGYILQHESIEHLIEKMRAAYNNEALVSPDMAAKLMARVAQLATQQSSLSLSAQTKLQHLQTLTAREEEVLGLIEKGYSNQKIADQLFIECGTVKNHVHNILKKLDVNNRREAASLYQTSNQSGHSVYA